MNVKCNCGAKIAETNPWGYVKIKCHQCKQTTTVAQRGLVTKVFDVKGKTVIVTELGSDDDNVYPLLRKAGYKEASLLVTVIDGRKNELVTMQSSAGWLLVDADMAKAHRYIVRNWEILESGASIEV